LKSYKTNVQEISM